MLNKIVLFLFEWLEYLCIQLAASNIKRADKWVTSILLHHYINVFSSGKYGGETSFIHWNVFENKKICHSGSAYFYHSEIAFFF